MGDQLIKQILDGASLRSVMQPDDEIPTNRPLHDECFDFPHIVIKGERFTAITAREISVSPQYRPLVMYYTNYRELFGTFPPVQAEPYVEPNTQLEIVISTQKRYKKFDWLTCGAWNKVWDSQGSKDLEVLRSRVLRAVPLKIVFLDEEDVWNIHPAILPQVSCNENSFLLQTAYIVYPLAFRKPLELEALIDNTPYIRTNMENQNWLKGMTLIKGLPFYAAYQLSNDGTYKSYYDLGRGNTVSQYKRLMVFAEA